MGGDWSGGWPLPLVITLAVLGGGATLWLVGYTYYLLWQLIRSDIEWTKQQAEHYRHKREARVDR